VMDWSSFLVDKERSGPPEKCLQSHEDCKILQINLVCGKKM